MLRNFLTTIISVVIFFLPDCFAVKVKTERLPRLEVSDDGHFLRTADGRPFFYLGDTAWELFHRLTREEADLYLQDRASKGFTVIQAVALAELDGLSTPNAYGYLPLVNRDPSCPDIHDGEKNDYWDFVDYVINKANSLGMYVGLLPSWGCYWNDKNCVFNEQNAESYGRFIAKRYGNCGMIWILGGDRNPDTDGKKSVIRAMARGIRSIDKTGLITFHPSGWNSSSTWFHGDEFLSFNGRQNGHTARYQSYKNTLDDYNRLPAKPVIDLEPLYEDHPLEFRPDENGHSIAADMRRAVYWDVFNGACGFTYGHHSVWQMYDPQKYPPVNRPLMTWREALSRPGASQVCTLRRLMESRPFFGRKPAPDFIISADVPSSVPGGEGLYRIVATIGHDGAYAMVYSSAGRTFSVRGDMLSGKRLTVWLFNPRTGEAQKIATLTNKGKAITLTPPQLGEPTDWVWVIDDTARHFSAPGTTVYNKTDI